MSYAPGHDGPPVAELDHLENHDVWACHEANPGSTSFSDWYYGERWNDAGNAQRIITCTGCNQSYRTAPPNYTVQEMEQAHDG